MRENRRRRLLPHPTASGDHLLPREKEEQAQTKLIGSTSTPTLTPPRSFGPLASIERRKPCRSRSRGPAPAGDTDAAPGSARSAPRRARAARVPPSDRGTPRRAASRAPPAPAPARGSRPRACPARTPRAPPAGRRAAGRPRAAWRSPRRRSARHRRKGWRGSPDAADRASARAPAPRHRRAPPGRSPAAAAGRSAPPRADRRSRGPRRRRSRRPARGRGNYAPSPRAACR